MMGDPQNGRGLRSMAIALLSGLCLLSLPSWSIAQSNTPSAELKRVVGRVEILAKGQTQWIPAVVGARLAAGDDIRAYSGASAELTLPATGTVVLTENSRLLMSKMEYDSQGQGRLMLLHLVVGKVRATVAQAAVSLARVRQSNFAISSPTLSDLVLALDASEKMGGDPRCRSRSVSTTEVIVPVETTAQGVSGRWTERWTVDRCGMPVPYVVKFDRAPDGDLD